MGGDEEKVAFTQKVVANSAEQKCAITFADFRNQHADGMAAHSTQRTGQGIWPIIELFRGCQNPFLRRSRNLRRRRGPVQHCGNRCRRESQIMGKVLKSYWLG